MRVWLVNHERGGAEEEVEVDMEEDLAFLRFQVFSLTEIPPEEQRLDGLAPGVEDSTAAAALGLADGARVGVYRRGSEAERAAPEPDDARHARIRAERQARIREAQAGQERRRVVAAALLSARESLEKMVKLDQSQQRMKRRLAGCLSGVLEYENPPLQRRARETLPADALRARARERAEGTGEAERDCLLAELMEWFKKDFFTWVNNAPCERCDGATEPAGRARPNEAEAHHRAGVVELYKCAACDGHVTRFPRYNDSGKLLETRRGRCGEWANCFTLLCRALGFEARAVHDWTDHVWTEVYSDACERWVHCDPCENARDAPLMYSEGWGKKLNYVIAFSRDEVLDVTRRYVERPDEAMERRTLCSEEWLAGELARLDQSRARMNGAQRRAELAARRERELAELEEGPAAGRRLREAEKHGRVTGSAEWRRARGEIGTRAAEDCAVPPAAAAPADESKEAEEHEARAAAAAKARVKAVFAAYLVQVTRGCGREACESASCRSSGACALPASLDKKAAATLALAMVKRHREAGLCGPLRERLGPPQ